MAIPRSTSKDLAGTVLNIGIMQDIMLRKTSVLGIMVTVRTTMSVSEGQLTTQIMTRLQLTEGSMTGVLLARQSLTSGSMTPAGKMTGATDRHTGMWLCNAAPSCTSSCWCKAHLSVQLGLVRNVFG